MARKSNHLEPRQVAFDADAFDLPADNCAALSITPFLSDTYEAEPIENAELAGVGHAKCTHIGKVLWEVRDDNGLPIYIDDREVLVCPSMQTRILAIGNWAKQSTRRRKDQRDDLTHIATYANVS